MPGVKPVEEIQACMFPAKNFGRWVSFNTRRFSLRVIQVSLLLQRFHLYIFQFASTYLTCWVKCIASFLFINSPATSWVNIDTVVCMKYDPEITFGAKQLLSRQRYVVSIENRWAFINCYKAHL
jgi:hypothetical protein